MRRRQSSEEPPKPAPRRCERCGATASATALRCTICGQSFASADQVSRLWGPVAAPPAREEPPPLDLYAGEGAGRIVRTGGDQPAEASHGIDVASTNRATVGPTSDPWASGSDTLASLPGKPQSGAFVAPAAAVSGKRTRTRGSGPRRTLIALLLILIVGGSAAWFAGRPYPSQQVAGNVGGAIDNELERVSVLPVDESGRIRLVERDISRSLEANADAYAPITDPRVALSRSGVRVTFTLYGVEHSLTGTLAVVDGCVVVVDPVLVGPARQLIDVAGVTAATEESLADMFVRLDARPVSVKTSDDTVVIVTEPV